MLVSHMLMRVVEFDCGSSARSRTGEHKQAFRVTRAVTKVDSLLRATSGHADFPEIFSQNQRLLKNPPSDLDERRAKWK